MKRHSALFRLGFLFLFLLVCLLLAVTIGTSGLSLDRLVSATTEFLYRKQKLGPDEVILFQIRFPRVILAAIVGSALAMAGVAFQAVLRNPLADPYIVGTSSGAALGATTAILLHLGTSPAGFSWIPVFAFIGAVGAMFLVYSLARVGDKIPVETFLLAGVVVGALVWAMVSLLLTLTRTELPRIIFWMMGSLQGADWLGVIVSAGYLIIGGIWLMLLANPLNLISVGEETAQHSGVQVERVKVSVVLAASLITAAAVSVSGIIGFVGLVIPHTARMILGADNRLLLPASALIGAIFLIWCDTFSRVVFTPQEIPVGVITALIGAPFFLLLLYKRRKLV
ncbi:MAG: iron ABC transporter permease [Candidatus Eremiobacteraeota bacterium]|nr:iron ABC transporter permease [Candidatus Eremiobacteraeota bacterium]